MPLKRIIRKQHKIKQHPQRPNIHRPRIRQILQNLRRHVFLRPTHRTSRARFHRPGKPKISNLIDPPSFFGGFDENVFGFDVAVDVVFLVDDAEALEDLHEDVEGVAEGEAFCFEFGLVGEEVALVAEL